MIDGISITKKKAGDKVKPILKPWGTHLEDKIEKAKIDSLRKKENSNAEPSPPDLEEVFSDPKVIEAVIMGAFAIALVCSAIAMTTNLYSAIQSASSEVGSSINEDSQSKSIVIKEHVAETSYKKPIVEVVEQEPISHASIELIDKKLSKLKLEKEIYISRPISELDLSLDNVDALLHCDYLQFKGEVLSFKSSYSITFSCVMEGQDRSIVVEKRHLKSRDNLEFSGYVLKDKIIFSHDDNVRFAEMLGYENLINYESRKEIQEDYVSWLSKSLKTWHHVTR